jgi:hypothetical protein
MNKLATAVLGMLLIGSAAVAQQDPMVAGAAMYPTKNIVENAMNSNDLTSCPRAQ